MKIKICGLCRPEDALFAAHAGADYLGVILARRGPRAQSLEDASRVFAETGRAQRVGVFADQPVKDVVEACERLELDVVQLHGREPAAFVEQLQRSVSCRVWKAVALEEAGDLERAVETYGDLVNGLLFDGPRAGSGTAFDWNLAVDARALLAESVELIIAGGLTPENVGGVIEAVIPDVVDVASGVEEKTCEKSKERIERFIRNALR